MWENAYFFLIYFIICVILTKSLTQPMTPCCLKAFWFFLYACNICLWPLIALLSLFFFIPNQRKPCSVDVILKWKHLCVARGQKQNNSRQSIGWIFLFGNMSFQMALQLYQKWNKFNAISTFYCSSNGCIHEPNQKTKQEYSECRLWAE